MAMVRFGLVCRRRSGDSAQLRCAGIPEGHRMISPSGFLSLSLSIPKDVFGWVYEVVPGSEYVLVRGFGWTNGTKPSGTN